LIRVAKSGSNVGIGRANLLAYSPALSVASKQTEGDDDAPDCLKQMVGPVSSEPNHSMHGQLYRTLIRERKEKLRQVKFAT
jgi:hypothetical protein